MPPVGEVLLLTKRPRTAIGASELELGVAARRRLKVDAAVVGDVAAYVNGGAWVDRY
jgi:hypothetical protein